MDDAAVSARPFDAAARREEVGARAARLVERATAGGAEGAEAICHFGEAIAVRYEHGDLKLTQVDEGAASGLRVMKGGRVGFAATNQVDEEDLGRLASDALEIAAISPPDEHNVLPEPGEAPSEAPPLDAAMGRISVEEVVEAARELVARTLAVDSRLSLDNASLELRRDAVGVVSSTGIRVSEADASISASLFGMAIDGDDVAGFDYWGGRTREWASLEDVLVESIERFTSVALGNLAAGAAESYRGPVLFAPAAFAQIFVSPLVGATSAIAVQRGRSPLADKSGERIADERLSIVDDPTDLSLAGACTFDREGIACAPFSIVEAGVLRGWMYNSYAAHVDGVRSTGHARGGTRAAPGLGAHALRVSGGAGGDESAMLARLDRGLVVRRFSGTVDPSSGDFSGVAKSARWVEGGQVVRGVRETLISGNAFELLDRLIELSSESESIMGSSRAPWALIDGLSVTAG